MHFINPRRGFWRVFTSALAFATVLTPTLQASPAMEKLFYILKQKGSITADEYDLLIDTMKQEDAEKERASQPASATSPALVERLEKTESKVDNLESSIVSTRGQVEELSRFREDTSPSTLSKVDLDALLSDKWYERLKLSGYMQFRGDGVLRSTGGDLHVPADSFASDGQMFGIRRGRLKVSGDVTDHLYLYAQLDFFGSSGGVNVLQARDYYADISLDPARESRVRFGLTKIPFGWVNMQSSQNRIALERPDAINSAVEGERDFGAFYYWTPYEIRNRFKDLVKMGLRGSGDYGVLALGAYNGQGINRSDLNGQPHYVARLAYPFEFDNGQILELGIAGYTGKFVPTVAGGPGAPTFGGGGVRDERVGISAILYPQPFGIEAEWNWGRGPQLDTASNTIIAQSLQGGYVQACYRHVFANQKELIPFIRWQTYDGGRKFATNAPRDQVDEIGVGIRYIPYPELELSFMYNRGTRTNTTVAPFPDVKYDYIGLQAQINF